MLLAASGLLAQQTPGPETAADPGRVPTFRSDVSLVKVDVKVTSPQGGSIGDLRQEDFQLFDEGEPQTITYFGRESEPVELLLVLDVSGSMRRALSDMASTTGEALNQLRPGDKVALMLFAERHELVLPFTENVSAAQAKIVGSIYKRTLGQETLVNEALLAATQYLQKEPSTARRAVLLVTDNGGSRQRATDDQVAKALLDADVTLNSLLVGDSGRQTRPSAYQNPSLAQPDVYRFAEQTGGEVMPGSSIGQNFRTMVERIASRYSLQYSAPLGTPGKFRKIRVELTPEAQQKLPGAKVNAREGYYAEQ